MAPDGAEAPILRAAQLPSGFLTLAQSLCGDDDLEDDGDEEGSEEHRLPPDTHRWTGLPPFSSWRHRIVSQGLRCSKA